MNPVRVALVGNPNTGKTTLFNALTGLRHRVANYPGVTVEKRWGIADHSKIRLEVLDLPGINSLDPHSQDEKIVHDVLCGEQEGTNKPEVVIALIDPFQMEKNLYLVRQLMRLKCPMVVAVNFIDEARKRNLNVDLLALQKKLGVPVVGVSGLQREGLETLREKVALRAKSTPPKDAAVEISQQEDSAAIYAWAEKVVQDIFSNGVPVRDLSARLDAFFLHPIFGPLALASIMFLIFEAIFSWAILPMDAIASVCTAAGAWIHRLVPWPLLAGFLSDGVVAGVGSVLSFLPQIALLFLFIGILEDTGYLARAAFLLDQFMSKVGLNGKAFLPLFSCFACAVPGIMAARVIENRRERLATILVSPFMSCSARIPIYALITAALIPARHVLGFLNLQALVFFGLYVLGIIAAVIMSWVFKKGLPNTGSSHFFLELPAYRVPHVKTLFLHVWERSSLFIKNAGSIILVLSVVLWVISSFPRPANFEHADRSVALQESVAGRMGHWIEPVIKPLGFDWKVGVGILASFAQREIFVSTMAILYNVGAKDGSSMALAKTLQQEKDPVTGAPLYPPLVGISILVFYALACQCMSTLAVVRKETGTWRWPVFMFLYMGTLAYLASLVIYQGGKLLGFA